MRNRICFACQLTLVFAQQGQVQQDGERGGVGGQDDDLACSTVQGLGGLVCALLQLAVMAGLLDEVEDLLRESLLSDGPCGAGYVRHDEVGDWGRKSFGARLARIICRGFTDLKLVVDRE